jgi:hydroxymethylpyrimidine pyrophosphatase-like HAD family hydrolase
MFDLSQVCLVATDMDGTLTTGGKFNSRLLETFNILKLRGIEVLIVTGRSAGWVSGIVNYLPVVGAVAENGGLYYPGSFENGLALTPIANIPEHRHQLEIAFSQLQAKFPQIRESTDNQFRITDWTFDVMGLHQDDLMILNNMCQQMGWGFTYSTVQCHIKPQGQDKAVGLTQVLKQYFPQYKVNQVVTIGDSPNDESLFDASYFPLSVGVANISEYLASLQHRPVYITDAAEGEGFCELAELILQQKS